MRPFPSVAMSLYSVAMSSRSWAVCSFLKVSEVYFFLDGTGSTSLTDFDRNFPFLST